MAEYALVADVGGTRTRAALVSRSGEITAHHSTDTMPQRGRDAVMSKLAAALEHVVSAKPSQVVGVGLSLASPVEPGTGVMYNPPNLGPEWDMYTPIPFLSERLSLPVFAGNDATLGAVGEHAYGAGRGCSNMVYMTVSTGIGGGVIINDRLYTGTHGFGGEIGHMTIEQNGALCNCGNIGCLESLASGTALAVQSAQLASRGSGQRYPGHVGRRHRRSEWENYRGGCEGRRRRGAVLDGRDCRASGDRRYQPDAHI